MKVSEVSSESLVTMGLFALYAAGYLIVNMYLATHNLTEASWLSFNYIKAGISFLGFTLPPVLIAYYTTHDQEQVPIPIVDAAFAVLGALGYGCVAFTITGSFSATAESVAPIKVVIIAVAFVAASTFLFAALKPAAGTPNWGKKHGLPWFYLLVAVVIIWVGVYGMSLLILYFISSGVVCQVIVRQMRRIREKPSLQRAVWAAIAGITFLLVACVLYGVLFYRWMPLQLGGGRPYFTRFYLQAEALDKLVKSGAITSPAVLQAPVEVVYISEKNYYVLLNGNAVALPIESITGYAGSGTQNL